MAKLAGFAVSAVILLVGLSACGGSSSSSTSAANTPGSTPGSTTSASTTSTTSSGGAATTSAAIAADPSGQLKFDKTSLAVKAGTDKFAFTNKASLPHNFTIQKGTNGPVVGATPTFSGSTKTLSVKLKPGTYTFYCSVPGHRQGGMQGTLTVK